MPLTGNIKWLVFVNYRYDGVIQRDGIRKIKRAKNVAIIGLGHTCWIFTYDFFKIADVSLRLNNSWHYSPFLEILMNEHCSTFLISFITRKIVNLTDAYVHQVVMETHPLLFTVVAGSLFLNSYVNIIKKL